MLTKILIKNFTLIDSLEIDYHSGFTTVTGDTGSGKSILLNALSLIIGKRGSQNLLKDSFKKCVLEAEFDLKNFNIKKIFDKNGLDYYEGTILRREILPNGKSRSFINDSPVNLELLKSIGEKLIDIHTQNQSLFNTNNNFFFSLIDSLAEQQNIVKNFNEVLQDFNEDKSQLEKLKRLNTSLINDNDYFLYLYNELEDSNLKEGEQEEIENKFKLLKNAENIKSNFSEIHNILFTGDSIENKLYSVNNYLENLSKYTSEYSDVKNRLQSILIELGDIQSELDNPNLELFDDLSQVGELEARLDLIYNLQKKHSLSTVKELLEKKDKLKDQLNKSGDIEIDIKELEKSIKKKELFLNELSKKISISRKKILPKLKLDLESLLSNLGMKNCSFKFNISQAIKFNQFGSDEIEVLFSANKGVEHDSLFKVASGGELSRILLSIKYILSMNLNLPTMIFDEIDTGVSGEISNSMANMMLDMSKNMQIIAITHLPQVAAKGNQQFNVYKKNKLNTTITYVKLLNYEERIDQIARMLAGDKISDSALFHAKQLLN
ncbi:MAG: DNA repair protein RecN [Flavobacteriaceae bacterium]|nr:DNA repair protein RecN [Flavobacteriaceae bacterium]